MMIIISIKILSLHCLYISLLPWLLLLGDEERVEHMHSHHMQVAQHFFPSSICAAALPIIHLLEDLEVNLDGVAGECDLQILCDLELNSPHFSFRSS